MNGELSLLSVQLKRNIISLIESDHLSQAKAFLDEYAEIVDDPDIAVLKGVIDQRIRQKTGQFWSNYAVEERPKRIDWWESDLIIRHVNQLVCGAPLEGFNAGFVEVVSRKAAGRCFERAVSVGCGRAEKEMNLIREGLVHHFVLFELSEEQLSRGKALARELGVEEQVTFSTEDAFQVLTEEGSFDLVYWNNSLHHMLDVEQAVAWSHRLLKPQGLFCMDDYVGPTRFQWSEQCLSLVNRIRRVLPDEYLKNPAGPGLLRVFPRPDPQVVEATDPTEAADSGRILDAVRRYFPDADITLTGGVVYMLALLRIIHNFDETDPRDRTLLDLLMIIDELCTRIPGLESPYATALAFKAT